MQRLTIVPGYPLPCQYSPVLLSTHLLSDSVCIAERVLADIKPRPSRFPKWYSYSHGFIPANRQAESITEGTLKQWTKQVGDFVTQDEEIATIETDKVSPTVGIHSC